MLLHFRLTENSINSIILMKHTVYYYIFNLYFYFMFIILFILHLSPLWRYSIVFDTIDTLRGNTLTEI